MKKTIITALLLSTSTTLTSLHAQSVEPPTMGWSSWNTFAVNISEDIIKGQADAMVNQGLKDVGYMYINIDDGFQYGRTSEGKVRIHPQRFPNGLKVVSDYIHSKGLKAGIYSDAGDRTCGSQSNGDVMNTNVGFYGHEQVDADFYFIENNFDFIKVDYCGGIHLGLNEQEQYTAIANALKNTGKDLRYNLCRWAYPGTWCHDISTSWRTTGDIYDGWESVKGILAENLYMSAYCYDGCYNDMDMLEVGRSMTKEEDQTHFGMWCIMASPLLIGCNMETIRPEALALLKNTDLIALNQDPLGLQAYVVQHTGNTYVLVKDIETLHGNVRAVALYNPTDKAEKMCVSASEIDLGGKLKVRDLLEQRDLTVADDAKAISATVPAHGTRFYRIEAEQRLERYIYEGETAYLSEYQEIYNNESAETAIYISSGSANGDKYAGWLGKKATNDLQWRDVYSQEGGEYVAHFRVGSQESRSFTVQVNGVDVQTVAAQTGGWETFKEYDVTLNLQKGSNVVRLYNDSGWMPNIDYMTIEKVGENTILDRRLQEALTRLTASEGCTTALKNKIQDAVDRASVEGLTDAEKTALITELENLLKVNTQVMAICDEFAVWNANAEKNIAVSIESSALTTLKEKIASAITTLDEADTTTSANRALTSIKSALKAYLKSSEALPREGEALDMTFLITNFDFSTDTGWQGSPTYRSGCGEEYNKVFDMYQTISAMRPGIYTIKVNALYRTTHNDGGAAYKAGTEVIPAWFYVNDEQVRVKSLYSESWPEASHYGGVDNLNGYPHSMYAAGLRFAEGLYENTIVLTQQNKGSIKIGLKCDEAKDGCWCCFDNFSMSYQPLPETEGIGVVTTTKGNGKTYDVEGRQTNNTSKGIRIKGGKKVLVK